MELYIQKRRGHIKILTFKYTRDPTESNFMIQWILNKKTLLQICKKKSFYLCTKYTVKHSWRVFLFCQQKMN